MSFQEPILWTDAEDAAHRPYSVSEITSQVKGLLEENLPKCWVEGEISQYNHHSSGHRYFTLKDNASQLSAVMFKWQASSLSFIPQQGMQVQVYGHISVYERGGKYQLYAEQLKPAGVGELAIAFEQLKNRLAAEGLFDERPQATPAPVPSQNRRSDLADRRGHPRHHPSPRPPRPGHRNRPLPRTGPRRGGRR